MVRPPKEVMEEQAEPLEGISKFHSIWITSGGNLRGSVLSCNECTISSRCGLCDISEDKIEKNQKKTTKYKMKTNINVICVPKPTNIWEVFEHTKKPNINN